MAEKVTKLVRLDQATVDELDRLRVGRESYDHIIRRLVVLQARVDALQSPPGPPAAREEVGA